MNMAQAVKKCAIDAIEASIPCDVTEGIVETVEPLRVKVGENIIPSELLVVSKNLEYKSQIVEFSYYDVEIVINEGIKEGDVLILIRKSGGERFVAVAKI